MTVVHLPEDLGDRLSAEAARRGMTVDEVAAEALAAKYPVGDALEAFIGSGRSGRSDLGRNHDGVRAEALADKAARDF